VWSTFREVGLSGKRAACLLGLFWIVLGAVVVWQHVNMPLPPHSSHDGFLLVPQLKHLMSGSTPDDPHFGMFNPTWFSHHAVPTELMGMDGVAMRVFGNVQDHTWIDAPHPLLLMAFVSQLVGGGSIAPVVIQWLYLGVLVLSMYSIGARVHSRSVGVCAGFLTLGAPGIFGAVQYIEPHLALVAMSTASVALLLSAEGLRRIGMAVVSSMVIWSLSRTGEGSGDAVIAGLVVVGPMMVTIINSDKSLPPARWILGLTALLLPLMLLLDVSWCIAAMERVTRAFADPAVQTDVVEKGGVLAHPFSWMGAYGVLMVTDYLRPVLSVFCVAGLWGLRRAKIHHTALLLVWAFVPWLALSWMQRKASWYGLVLIPPVLMWASIGLHSLGPSLLKRAAMVSAMLQFGLFSMVSADRFPAGWSMLREPLQLHEWRLRRIDFLRPMDTDENHRVRKDLDLLINWLEKQENPGPVALMTMGTRSDYAARYYLSMSLPGLEVINLMDPRVRSAAYRNLHPNDFSVLVFLDDGARPWPPSAAQRAWLVENIRCETGDPFDAFSQAVFSRASGRVDGFYPLEGTVEPTTLGAGQIWSSSTRVRGLCDG
jgi:hypothetical protein